MQNVKIAGHIVASSAFPPGVAEKFVATGHASWTDAEANPDMVVVPCWNGFTIQHKDYPPTMHERASDTEYLQALESGGVNGFLGMMERTRI